jgi:hypothetical protein
VSLGATPRQRDLFRSTTSFCAPLIADDSIYGLLHRECFSLFPDELFSDLFTDIGRRSVPPMVVAVVMVLQRLEGLSDREAVERFTFDARWKYAAGGLDFDYPGFVHTVLVDMRARLANSEQPNRIFEVVLDVGRQAGLVGRRRVLDSSPIYDAVATMDTVTLVRSAIRGLLAAAGELEGDLRERLRRDDDYASPGKPVCDYEDRAAREALVDALAKDGHALLLTLEGRHLPGRLAQAAELLAAVVGQDLEVKAGVFRIVRRVAKDRIISTVDPDTRQGHKTQARSFDGYKGHVAIEPDSELVTGRRSRPAIVATGRQWPSCWRTSWLLWSRPALRPLAASSRQPCSLLATRPCYSVSSGSMPLRQHWPHSRSRHGSFRWASTWSSKGSSPRPSPPFTATCRSGVAQRRIERNSLAPAAG